MTSARPITALIVAVLVIAISGSSITSSSAYSTPKSTQKLTRSSSQPINRGAFLAKTSAACLTFLSTSQPAFAKDDAALKGTKKDPEFEACLGNCLYECTKPKGAEQRSRKECIPECRSKCATTKQQMMTGTPTKKE